MEHSRRKPKQVLLVALERGEAVIPSVLEICEQQGIGAAWVQGIGAVCDVEIGAFDLQHRRYETTCPAGDWELLSLQGNIGRDETGAHVFHPHVVLGDLEGNTVGGHLFQATCAVTVELAIQEIGGTIQRRIDPEIGLKLWKLR